jgi:hypothetical protein
MGPRSLLSLFGQVFTHICMHQSQYLASLPLIDPYIYSDLYVFIGHVVAKKYGCIRTRQVLLLYPVNFLWLLSPQSPSLFHPLPLHPYPP